MNTRDVSIDAACGRDCSCVAVDSSPQTIGRRAFLGGGAAALAAIALAACGGEGITSPASIASTNLELSDFPALANVGGVATMTVNRVPLAIVRTGSTSFVAFSRICPHRGGTINVTSSGFRCPNHGATFNSTGQWVGGQSTSNLKSYPVAYDAMAGTLIVGG